MFRDIIDYVKSLYPRKEFISLHEPLFIGNERRYVSEAIDSTFVSSVGKFVDRFENEFCKYVGGERAIVTSNGTSALHAGLHVLGVGFNDEVLTQALTFVATSNAITYCGAWPVFIDSDIKTMGMSPVVLKQFLLENAVLRDGCCYNKKTGRAIKACIPMHVFGHPVQITKIVSICDEYNIPVLEDAAESVGSTFNDRQTGLFGKIGVYSFNGNKIITSGGGGLIITKDVELGKKIKHLTTTAKVPHAWDFFHDEVGFNYRMPNLNAAFALGQLEMLNSFIDNKRQLAGLYREYFKKKGIQFVDEPEGAKSNFWLNAIVLDSREQRDIFLMETNKSSVMTRPIWRLMSDLPMYKNCQTTDLECAKYLEDRVVNLPSSVRNLF